MPELPDVEGQRRYVSRFAAGKRIDSVEVSDSSVLKNTTPQALGQALAGAQFDQPRRHGKWLIAPAGESKLLFHFGMTGYLEWRSDRSDLHRNTRVTLNMRDGHLGYVSQRKFGGIWRFGAEEDVREATGELGPDAGQVNRREFSELISEKTGAVKSALMDQSMMAGIGNELADEILLRAKVQPQAKVRRLEDDRIDAIYGAMHDVLRESIKHGQIPAGDGWLKQARKNHDEHRCPGCGGRIRKEKVGGRTTLWCPACQEE